MHATVFQSLADSHASFFLKPSGRVATFSLKSFSASAQTLAVFLSFSCSKLSSRPALKDSEASRGRREGRWSMLRGISFKSRYIRGMYLRDDREGDVVLVVLDLDRHSRLVESGVDSVDGDGVVGVGGIARHIADDAQLAAGSRKKVVVDEGRNGLREVDLLSISKH